MDDSSAILAFLMKNDDFSVLVEGKPYPATDVMSLLLESPPGVEMDYK
jgi:hypothetical protein